MKLFQNMDVVTKKKLKAWAKYLGGAASFLTGLWFLIDGSYDLGRINGSIITSNIIAGGLSDEELAHLKEYLNEEISDTQDA